MKKNLTIALAVMSATVASAAWADSSGQWTCTVSGETSVGGPVGQVWQTVMGHGATQFEAQDNAMNTCYGEGLQQCSPGTCSQDPDSN
jgi:hypothetical protein